MSGNSDGSFTPEQQARFGSSKPGEQASMAITKAMQYLGQPCTDCRNKVAAIDGAITSLLEARVLYQDDPGSVKLIDQQIDQLKAGITKDELARGMAGVISDKDKGIAGLLLGAPSRLVTGAATAELLERTILAQAIKNVRLGLPSDIKKAVMLQRLRSIFLAFLHKWLQAAKLMKLVMGLLVTVAEIFQRWNYLSKVETW